MRMSKRFHIKVPEQVQVNDYTRPVPKSTGHDAINGWAVDFNFLRLLHREVEKKCGSMSFEELDALMCVLYKLKYINIR